jgi:hypothetical protein
MPEIEVVSRDFRGRAAPLRETRPRHWLRALAPRRPRRDRRRSAVRPDGARPRRIGWHLCAQVSLAAAHRGEPQPVPPRRRPSRSGLGPNAAPPRGAGPAGPARHRASGCQSPRSGSSRAASRHTPPRPRYAAAVATGRGRGSRGAGPRRAADEWPRDSARPLRRTGARVSGHRPRHERGERSRRGSWRWASAKSARRFSRGDPGRGGERPRPSQGGLHDVDGSGLEGHAISVSASHAAPDAPAFPRGPRARSAARARCRRPSGAPLLLGEPTCRRYMSPRRKCAESVRGLRRTASHRPRRLPPTAAAAPGRARA